ncbi:MAG: proline racemase family protein, partial [Proteobacteria bacterium]|nr:proline racemase family protein [Pseudomonadota bacterium]
MSAARARRLRVIDSHTAGEPTRVLIEGAPALPGELPAKLVRLRDEHDWLRRALILEPRGSEVLVGAVLTEGISPGAAAGAVYFNNVGYLGMCGHGTIGLVATLAHLGRIAPGDLRIDTPVGTVRARLHESGEVSVFNVPAYRHAKARRVDVPDVGAVSGDVAWGGNWFFICNDHGLPLDAAHIPDLTCAALA